MRSLKVPLLFEEYSLANRASIFSISHKALFLLQAFFGNIFVGFFLLSGSFTHFRLFENVLPFSSRRVFRWSMVRHHRQLRTYGGPIRSVPATISVILAANAVICAAV
jgi:hypothetical protein